MSYINIIGGLITIIGGLYVYKNPLLILDELLRIKYKFLKYFFKKQINSVINIQTINIIINDKDHNLNINEIIDKINNNDIVHVPHTNFKFKVTNKDIITKLFYNNNEIETCCAIEYIYCSNDDIIKYAGPKGNFYCDLKGIEVTPALLGYKDVELKTHLSDYKFNEHDKIEINE